MISSTMLHAAVRVSRRLLACGGRSKSMNKAPIEVVAYLGGPVRLRTVGDEVICWMRLNQTLNDYG